MIINYLHAHNRLLFLYIVRLSFCAVGLKTIKMSNIGREIQDFYCNGFAGRRYDLAGSKIEFEADDYMIIRTESGEPIFIGFFTYVNDKIYKDGWHYKDKQKMIDEWCGEVNEA